ncbi:putative Ig domain-containing protein [Burkholderia sp. RS02]|uniref:putative Ig domain-containing protein n=1 Tax=unclassified Burkholderia TaxID=2613784 RepID=UPI0032188504
MMKISLSKKTGRVNNPFSGQITVADAVHGGIYKFHVVSGDQIHFDVNGKGSGTPYRAGKITIKILAKKIKNQNDTPDFDHPDIEAFLDINILDALKITPVNGNALYLRAGTAPINAIKFAVTGGVGPYEWEIDTSQGILPPGVTLNKSTGALEGVPAPHEEQKQYSTGQIYIIKIVAKSSVADMSAVAVREIHVYPKLEIEYRDHNPPVQGQDYAAALNVPYAGSSQDHLSFSVTPGDTGLEINKETGYIYGKPKNAGLMTLHYSVKDLNGYEGKGTKRISVAPPGALTLALPTQNDIAYSGERFHKSVTCTNSFGSVQYRLLSVTPQDMKSFFTLTDNGELTGTVPEGSEITEVIFDIVAMDASGRTNMTEVNKVKKGTEYPIKVGHHIRIHRLPEAAMPVAYVGKEINIDLVQESTGRPFTGIEPIGSMPIGAEVIRGTTILKYTPPANTEEGLMVIKYKLKNKYEVKETSLEIMVRKQSLFLKQITPLEVKKDSESVINLTYDHEYTGGISDIICNQHVGASIITDTTDERVPKLKVTVHGNFGGKFIEIRYAIIGNSGQSSNIGKVTLNIK